MFGISEFIERRRFAISLALNEGGVVALATRAAAAAYRIGVRPMLPSVPDHYAGVAVSATRKLGDVALRGFLRRAEIGNGSSYEFGLITGLGQVVNRGDRVLVIGGGIGVTCVVAAQLAGNAGSVLCLEGGADQVAAVKTTASMNGVSVDVRHAFVGNADHVYSSKDGARDVSIADLPPCDVLELDCEGAELQILTEMKIEPRSIVVESHGGNGSPAELLADILRRRGYQVTYLGVAEPSLAGYCEETDTKVLLGRLASEGGRCSIA